MAVDLSQISIVDWSPDRFKQAFHGQKPFFSVMHALLTDVLVDSIDIAKGPHWLRTSRGDVSPEVYGLCANLVLQCENITDRIADRASVFFNDKKKSLEGYIRSAISRAVSESEIQVELDSLKLILEGLGTELVGLGGLAAGAALGLGLGAIPLGAAAAFGAHALGKWWQSRGLEKAKEEIQKKAWANPFKKANVDTKTTDELSKTLIKYAMLSIRMTGRPMGSIMDSVRKEVTENAWSLAGPLSNKIIDDVIKCANDHLLDLSAAIAELPEEEPIRQKEKEKAITFVSSTDVIDSDFLETYSIIMNPKGAGINFFKDIGALANDMIAAASYLEGNQPYTSVSPTPKSRYKKTFFNITLIDKFPTEDLRNALVSWSYKQYRNMIKNVDLDNIDRDAIIAAIDKAQGEFVNHVLSKLEEDEKYNDLWESLSEHKGIFTTQP